VIAPSGQEDVQALIEGLDASKVLRRAERGGYAKARAYLLAPRSKVTKTSSVPQLGPLREETWAVVGEDGDLLMPVRRRYEPGVAGLLRENLEKVARYRLILDLENATSTLAGKVSLEILRKTLSGLEAPEIGNDSRPLFHEGDEVAFKISHQHEKPLFVYLLDLGLTGRIQLVYPVSGAEDCLLPALALEVGTQPGREISLYIPDEFPFLSAGPGEEVEGVETLKILFTTHPADLQPLFQSGVREVKGGPADSLDDLLLTTFGGGGYTRRDTRTRAQMTEGPEDWTVLTRSFRVRRPASSPVAAWGRGI